MTVPTSKIAARGQLSHELLTRELELGTENANEPLGCG
jgi:hypothetical protein